MHMILLGLNHASAPLAVRERLALPSLARAKMLAALSQGGIAECVLLVTCGRTELYAAGPGLPASEPLVAALAEASGESRNAFEPYLYQRSGAEALRHLLTVSAGLDSVVLGEPSMLAHVTLAYERAVEAGTAGTVLGVVFQAAMRVASRAQSETGIGSGAIGLPAVAAGLIARALDDIPGARVLVLGAGSAGRQAVVALRAHSAASIVTLNRTRWRADELAEQCGGTSEPLHRLPDLMSGAHALIASVTAPQPLVSESMVLRGALAPRRRPFIIADLALPRCVSYDAARLPAVQYLDLETVGTLARAGANGRSAAIPQVEAIVSEECGRVQGLVSGLQAEARIISSPKPERSVRRLEVE